MKYQKPQLIRCEFTESGREANCCVEIKPEPEDGHEYPEVGIQVRFATETLGNETLDTFFERVLNEAMSMLRAAAR